MRKKILFIGLLMVVMLVAMASAAFAKKKPKKEKIREMIFEGDVVETDFMKPNQESATLLRQRKRSLLLRPRTDFIEEIIKSAEDL